jgi:hypothetical protein
MPSKRTVFVPVMDQDGKTPLMPTTPSRARRWIKNGEATPFFKKGVFCVRLNRAPCGQERQPIVATVDPGSKREGFTVKSKAHTYLNIHAEAVTWVKDAVAARKTMRRGRRFRKTPCRPPGPSGAMMGAPKRLPPSTKARWGWKLRVLRWLSALFPVTDVGVEDVQAKTLKGKRRWNLSFSPLQVGKDWFYAEIRRLGVVLHLRAGFETKALRDRLGLQKTGRKLAETFAAHCVDSWVIAWDIVGGSEVPDNRDLLCIQPIRVHRRQLHRLQPQRGGERLPYGGTRSHGFKRGSLVRHAKWGLAYVGGVLKDRISLHHSESGKRLTQNAKPADCRFLTYNMWKFRFVAHTTKGEAGMGRSVTAALSLPGMNAGVSRAK